MLLIPQILVRTFALGASAVALAACGQQGPLFLPPSDVADRSILPESSLQTFGKTQASTTGSSPLPLAPQPATAISAP
jgi:predicted small lipoprotein YifL